MALRSPLLRATKEVLTLASLSAGGHHTGTRSPISRAFRLSPLLVRYMYLFSKCSQAFVSISPTTVFHTQQNGIYRCFPLLSMVATLLGLCFPAGLLFPALSCRTVPFDLLVGSIRGGDRPAPPPADWGEPDLVDQAAHWVEGLPATLVGRAAE